jgi:hypothetical protein
MVKWVQEVYQVQQELLEEEEGVVSEVQLDLLGRWENQDHQAEEVCLEMMDLLDQKVNLGTEVLLDRLVLRVNREVLEDLDPLECKV